MRWMKTILLAASAMAAMPAQAGMHAVYEDRDERRNIAFEIADDRNFRAGTEEQYRLVIDTDVYQVGMIDGRTYVARIEDLAAALKETSSPFLRNAMKAFTFLAADEPKRWERRGKAKVNGFRGREYKEVDESSDGKFDPFEDMEAESVIVSDDPALAPLGDAILHFTADELYLKRHFLSGVTSDQVLDSLDGLAKLGTVISASDGAVRLVSAEQAAIDPARLTVPAPPMARTEIVQMIRAKRNPFKL